MSKLSSWLLYLNLVVLTFFAINYWWFDMLEFVVETDVTGISLFIVAMYFAATTVLGLALLENDFGRWSSLMHRHVIHFPEYFVSLGLIGTLIGLIIVFVTGFASVDLTAIATAKESIRIISIGMGSAMITTLTGLVASLLLTIQFRICWATENELDSVVMWGDDA
jgi:hypothetical protein